MKHKWYKEICAWANGEEIEERWISQNTETDEWREAQTNPMWDCDGLEFRIKPQPKEPQYLYVCYNPETKEYSLGERGKTLAGRWINLGKIKLETDDD